MRNEATSVVLDKFAIFFFYINNYIDWEQYNTLYDAEFINTKRRLADSWYKKLKKPPGLLGAGIPCMEFGTSPHHCFTLAVSLCYLISISHGSGYCITGHLFMLIHQPWL